MLLFSGEKKSKIFELAWHMKKQGYAEATIESYVAILKSLKNKGADLSDPESVKEVIATQQTWSRGRQWNVCKAYTLYLKAQGLTWEKPRYKPVAKIPFIPIEKELDELIAGSSIQLATFLQMLKETGARRGEIYQLRWSNVDFVSKTVRVAPEKGSNPRLFKMSNKLIYMLSRLPKNSDKIWIYKSAFNLSRGFRKQRRRIASKLGNPRLLKIHFHTFRHWKATTEYVKTKDILYVQKLLGHKSLKSTLWYTQLIAIPQNEEFICKTATTVEEAKQLIEAGFTYITKMDDTQMFRKQKASYLGP
jgi:integrase/recombinase XerD